MELLAPVGSFSSFDAALEEGADAVYVGAPGLNARALSRDFTYPEIGAMISRAHASGVKLYLAANSLIKENEVALAIESLASLEVLKPDALIIQDPGLFYLARRYFPRLSLHASTLMSVHNSLAVQHFIDMGFARVVLPRELTIPEIRTLSAKTGAELEVFVHGAMCFSYSGLCLFSSLHGGKSSLRGRCVQPCRRQYTWKKKKARSRGRRPVSSGGEYLFSMNDLSGLEQLAELADAGVASLKIEGRLKSGEYVRKTVRAYRLVLDSLDRPAPARAKSISRACLLLNEAMGRRRSTGFFLGRRPEQATTPHLSGNVGMMVGKVHRFENGLPRKGKQVSVITVSLRHPVRVGDRLRLHDEKSGARTSFTLQSLKIGQRPVSQGSAGQKVRIFLQQKIDGRPGREFHGSLFRVDISSGRQDEKRAREKLLKGGNIQEVASDTRKIRSILDAFSAQPGPVSARCAFSHSTARQGERKKKAGMQWWVKVGSFRDMHFRLPVRPAKYVLPLNLENMEEGLRMSGKKHRPVVWSLPPVIMEENLDWYFRAAASLAESGYLEFQLGHFSQSAMFSLFAENHLPLRIYGDYTVNILNSLSLEKMRELGFAGVQFSLETDSGNLAAALDCFGRFRQKAEAESDFLVGMYVYGRPPLFTARLDSPAFRHGRRFASPRGEEYILSRQDDVTIVRSVIPFDLLDMQKKLAAMGVDYMLIDLSDGNMKRNASEFITHYSRKGKHSARMAGNFSATLM
jgi:putative protease